MPVTNHSGHRHGRHRRRRRRDVARQHWLAQHIVPRRRPRQPQPAHRYRQPLPGARTAKLRRIAVGRQTHSPNIPSQHAIQTHPRHRQLRRRASVINLPHHRHSPRNRHRRRTHRQRAAPGHRPRIPPPIHILRRDLITPRPQLFRAITDLASAQCPRSPQGHPVRVKLHSACYSHRTHCRRQRHRRAVADRRQRPQRQQHAQRPALLHRHTLPQ